MLKVNNPALRLLHPILTTRAAIDASISGLDRVSIAATLRRDLAAATLDRATELADWLRSLATPVRAPSGELPALVPQLLRPDRLVLRARCEVVPCVIWTGLVHDRLKTLWGRDLGGRSLQAALTRLAGGGWVAVRDGWVVVAVERLAQLVERAPELATPPTEAELERWATAQRPVDVDTAVLTACVWELPGADARVVLDRAPVTRRGRVAVGPSAGTYWPTQHVVAAPLERLGLCAPATDWVEVGLGSLAMRLAALGLPPAILARQLRLDQPIIRTPATPAAYATPAVRQLIEIARRRPERAAAVDAWLAARWRAAPVEHVATTSLPAPPVYDPYDAGAPRAVRRTSVAVAPTAPPPTADRVLAAAMAACERDAASAKLY